MSDSPATRHPSAPLFLGLAASLALASCATTEDRVPDTMRGGSPSADGQAGAGQAAKGGDGEAKPDAAELRRKLDVQRRKIELGRFELQVAEERHATAIAAARTELELAEGELADFRRYDAPTRVESANLDLRGTKDRAQEAAEELAQIEVMYEGQDLDDRTAEYVVSRGRRNAERAQQRIAIEERGFDKLTTRTLPAEEAKLVLAVERAKGALRDAEANAHVERTTKGFELEEQQAEVAKLTKELEGAKP